MIGHRHCLLESISIRPYDQRHELQHCQHQVLVSHQASQELSFLTLQPLSHTSLNTAWACSQIHIQDLEREPSLGCSEQIVQKVSRIQSGLGTRECSLYSRQPFVLPPLAQFQRLLSLMSDYTWKSIKSLVFLPFASISAL